MRNIKEEEKLSVINHSCAHLMAHAIKKMYPHAKFWVGPIIEEGFYYDIDLGSDVLTEDDLPKIEKEMKKIAKGNKYINKVELSKEEALEMFKDDEYKMDLLESMDDNITAYKQEGFIDLCRGPHVSTTKELKHHKLLKVSGAYFKGDSKNKMLQRIYGVCFETAEELEEHLKLLEEAKKRDHRKLGKELGLFTFSEYGPGLPFWLENGMVIYRELENFWYEEHKKEGYSFIKTPTILSKELWEVSGHWENYKENMYTSEVDDKEYAIKPMNCPGGMLAYKNKIHSYKDLPLRVGELGHVHRHEASGALSGLFRVRSFTQDDAHIFMRESDIESEIIRLISFVDRVYKVFGLSYSIELSTRPEDKFIGEIEDWDRSEEALKEAIIKSGNDYKLNPGDGAFYGPKIDIHVKDAIGRSWQCGTIQLDMNLPERFDLTYVESDGSKVRPIMLHRVIYGAFERFIGVLIEHYAGAFPMWLAPVQVNVIPVNNEYHLDYAKEILAKLQENGFRVELDDRDEKLSYKMRASQTNKIPHTIIIGDSEVNGNLVSYRKYSKKDTNSLKLDEYVQKLDEIVKNKEQM